jgi:hypothetical protein
VAIGPDGAEGPYVHKDIGRARWFWLKRIERVWRNGRWDYSLPVRRVD